MNTPTPAPVDVLAWMLAADAALDWDERDADLHEQAAAARAAVAAMMAREQELRAALADAVDWIAAMRCDDTTTHPRLRVLRATLAKVQP